MLKKLNNLEKIFLVFVMGLVIFGGCQALSSPIEKNEDGYLIKKGFDFELGLKTDLNSKKNNRGDTFRAVLLKPVKFGKNEVLKEGAEIRGLIKRVVKYERRGDRAGMILLFDQVVLDGDRVVPLSASLDTALGHRALKIPGRTQPNMNVVGRNAVVGGLVGESLFGDQGRQQGLLVGAVAGVGTVLEQDAKELKLPVGTEMIVKLDQDLFLPE